MDGHWTGESIKAYKYAICSDFAGTIQKCIEERGTTVSQLAKVLGITEGRVSLFLERPGYLSLEDMIALMKFFELDLSIVTYTNHSKRGPISGGIFRHCWNSREKPQDYFDIGEV